MAIGFAILRCHIRIVSLFGLVAQCLPTFLRNNSNRSAGTDVVVGGGVVEVCVFEGFG